jgi:hypothetical protein
MFTSSIRRSVALVGVVAGLLAAAVPAGAAGVPVKAPDAARTGLKAGAGEVLYETVTVAPEPSDGHVECAWPSEVAISGLAAPAA